MKIKENYLLREIAEMNVVLPLGEASIDFNGMITLNRSGTMLWRILEKGASREDLVKALTENYNVSEMDAAKDVDEFIVTLDQTGCIDYEQ